MEEVFNNILKEYKIELEDIKKDMEEELKRYDKSLKLKEQRLINKKYNTNKINYYLNYSKARLKNKIYKQKYENRIFNVLSKCYDAIIPIKIQKDIEKFVNFKEMPKYPINPRKIIKR